MVVILLLEAASHRSELEPQPPIMAEQEGEATNPTPAMTQTYFHKKGDEGTQPNN